MDLPLKPPPQGLGQGNGALPTIWEIVSTPLLDYFREAGHGAVFKCCIYQDSFKPVGYCFVDDSTIIQIDPSPTTPTNYTIKLAQSGLDIFSGATQATGGQVNVNKIKGYLLEFKWDATIKWRLSENKADLLLNTPEVPNKN